MQMCPTVLEARTPNAGYWLGCFLMEAWRMILLHAFLLTSADCWQPWESCLAFSSFWWLSAILGIPRFVDLSPQPLTLSSHVSFSLLSLLSLILYLIRYLSLDSSLPSYSRILSTWDLFSKHSHIQSFLRSGHTHTLQEGTSYDPLQLVSLLYSQSGKSPIIHTHSLPGLINFIHPT